MVDEGRRDVGQRLSQGNVVADLVLNEALEDGERAGASLACEVPHARQAIPRAAAGDDPLPCWGQGEDVSEGRLRSSIRGHQLSEGSTDRQVVGHQEGSSVEEDARLGGVSEVLLTQSDALDQQSSQRCQQDQPASEGFSSHSCFQGVKSASSQTGDSGLKGDRAIPW